MDSRPEMANQTSRDAEKGASSVAADSAILLAVVAFGLAVRGGVLFNVVLVLVGLIASASAIYLARRGHEPVVDKRPGQRLEVRLVAAIVVLSVVGMIAGGTGLGPSSAALDVMPGVVWLLLTFGVVVGRRRGNRVALTTIVILIVTFSGIVGVLHVRATEGQGIDVLFLHKQAADAIANGENPYTDAVSVPNGSPSALPGDAIDGYVYPPVTALAYSLGEWTLDDPRYTSLAAWLVVLIIVAFSAIRNPRSISVYLLLLLAAQPGWPLVLRAAWTEPLSLALLTAAAFTWRRSTASGTGLGFALASKQYFVVAAPLLLLHRDSGWLKRVSIAIGLVVVTVGLGILWNPAAYWSATVVFHATTPPRADASNLVGLLNLFGVEFDPSTILTIGVGLVTATVIGRISRNQRLFLLGMTLTLGATFFVSSQAFANYWFLLMGICVLALASRGPNHSAASAPSSSSSQPVDPDVGSHNPSDSIIPGRKNRTGKSSRGDAL